MQFTVTRRRQKAAEAANTSASRKKYRIPVRTSLKAISEGSSMARSPGCQQNEDVYLPTPRTVFTSLDALQLPLLHIVTRDSLARNNWNYDTWSHSNLTQKLDIPQVGQDERLRGRRGLGRFGSSSASVRTGDTCEGESKHQNGSNTEPDSVQPHIWRTTLDSSAILLSMSNSSERLRRFRTTRTGFCRREPDEDINKFKNIRYYRTWKRSLLLLQ